MFNARTSNYFLFLSVLIAAFFIQSSLQQKRIWCKPLPKGVDPSDAVCDDIYDPVCAYRDEVPIGTTVGNACEACDQEGYDYYFEGECQGLSQEEDEDEEEGDSQEEEEGDSQEEEGDSQEEEEGDSQEEEGDSQEEEEGDSQEEEEGDSQEEEGDSQEEEEENRKKYKCVRPDEPFQALCTQEYDPVCAYHWDDDEGTTIGNRCVACLQNDYNYYTKGECDGDSQEEEGDSQEEEGDSQEEEGDSQEEEGDSQEEEGDSQEEEGDSQEEEGDSQEEEGDSQEEEGDSQEEEEENRKKYKCVRPDEPFQALCTQEYDPVCAYHWGDDEGTTIGNRCVACLQNDYNYYTKGECDGDSQEEEGDSQEEEGDSQEEEGDSQEEEGDSQEEEGDSQEEEGDSQEEEGDSQEEEGDSQEEEGSHKGKKWKNKKWRK